MLDALLAESPVVLAPMEDVTDGAFRRVCRALGAVVCVTEFIGAEDAFDFAKMGADTLAKLVQRRQEITRRHATV